MTNDVDAPNLKIEWLTENWDSGDPWGSCLILMGNVCDALTLAGDSDLIPDSCGYDAALGLSEPLEDEQGQDLLAQIDDGTVETTDLADDLVTLDRLAVHLQSEGRNY